jgi:hypothetical protein
MRISYSPDNLGSGTSSSFGDKLSRMTAQNSSSLPKVITDPEQVAFLTDPRLRPFVTSFLGRSASVSQVAAELNVKINAMLYRAQQLQACGLLKVDHLESRTGRAVRHYRCVADAFFVPFSATAFETLEAQVRQSEALLHHGFAQALGTQRQQQGLEEGWGTLLSRDAVGNVNVESVHLGLNSTGGASDLLPLSMWSNLYLRPDTALVFAERLRALFTEYTEQPSEEDGTLYLLHVGLTSA